MANIPTVEIGFTPSERSAINALSRVQSIADKRPIKVAFSTDTKSLKELDSGLGKLSGRADEFTKSLEASNARVLAFGASVSIIAAIQRSFSNLIKSTIDVEAAFKKISVVGDQFAKTSGDLERFGRGIFDIARQTGQAFDVTSEAALEFARQGLSASETLTRVKDALVLTRLSGIDAASSVEGLTATVNAFKKEGVTTTDVLNKLIAVDNKFAVSSADLIESLKRSASVAQSSNVSLDELIATTTALQEVTARGGPVIGNAIKSILARSGRSETIQAFRNLKVEVQDINGNLRPSIELLTDFSSKIKNLPQLQKNQAISDLAGVYQLNTGTALIDILAELETGASRYRDALSTTKEATNEADVANRKLNESLDSQLKALLATGTELGSLIGNISIAPLLSEGLSKVSGVGDFLIKELRASGPNLTKAAFEVLQDAFLVAGTAGAAAIVLFVKKFAIFAKDSISTVLGLNAAQKNQENIQLSILNVLRSRQDIAQQIYNLSGNEVAQTQVLANLYKRIADENARNLSISNAVAKNMSGAFVVGSSGVPVQKGKARGASRGFVPDLVQAEFNDVKRGVGGAKSNSGIIVLDDFPMGGGKKGPMVMNSSEAIMPMGSKGAAVLNQDMLDRMGYGKRAARGDVPYLSKAENSVRAELQKKRQDELKKLEKEASDALKAKQKAELDAAKAAEKQAKAAQREQEKLANQEIAEAKKRQKALEKANKERERADKIAQETARKSAEAELKAAKAKEEDFKKKFPVTAQLQRDQQLRVSGKLLPPISGGFGAFGRSTQEDVSRLISSAQLEKARKSLGGQFIDLFGSSLYPQNKTQFSGLAQAPTVLSGESFRKRQELVAGIEASQNPPISERLRQQRERIAAGPRFLAGPAEGKLSLTDRLGEKSIQSINDVSRALSDLAPEFIRAKKTFSEASIELGAQVSGVFFGASVVENGLKGLGYEVGNMVNVVRDATIAFLAIKKLGELKSGGGLVSSSSGFLDKVLGEDFKRGRKLGKRSGPLSGVEMDFLSQSKGASRGFKVQGALQSVSAFGSKVVGLLPVVGQFAAGLVATVSILDSFGIDVVGNLRKSFGGVSEETEKLQENFKELSQSAFKGSEFIGIGAADFSRSLKNQLSEIKERIEAERLGVVTKGKTQPEIRKEALSKEIENVLNPLKTGRTSKQRELQGGFIGRFAEVTREESFSNLDNNTKQAIQKTLGQIALQPFKDLSKVAESQLGLTPQKINELGLTGIRKLLLEKAAADVFAAIKDIPIGRDIPVDSESSLNFLTQTVAKFSPSGVKAALPEEKKGKLRPTSDLQQAQAQVKAALELRKLQLDFSSEEERILQTRLRTSEIDDVSKANLQAQLDLLAKQREIRSSILSEAESGLNELLSLDTIKDSDLLTTDIQKILTEIKTLGGSADDAKAKIQQLFSAESFVSSTETDNLKTRIFERLDGLKQISAEQLRQVDISGKQAEAEAKILTQIRERQQLMDLTFSLRRIGIETQKTNLEGQIGLIGAQSSNPNLTTRQQDSSKIKESELRLSVLQLSLEDERLKKEEQLINLQDQFAKGRITSIDVLEEEIKKVNAEYNNTTKSLNDQIAALEIQKGLIGAIVGESTAYADSIDQITRGLGQRSADNRVGRLQANDLSSLMNNLSERAALDDLSQSGLSGEEAIAFLSERIALREKESEISSAQTEVQKVQLSQEMALLKDIFRIRKEGGSTEKQISKLIEAQNARLKEQRSISGGVANARAQMQDEMNQFGSTFGETATTGFRDALSDAMKAAADNTGNLRDALLDVALTFANKLRDAALDNLANILTTGTTGEGGAVSGALKFLSGLFSGGVQAKAAGGKVTGGTGTKDDVPTLLMGGEYIINKKSVQKYGPQFFEALNNGSIRGMATGGQFIPGTRGQGKIKGNKNLRNFAGQAYTNGNTDLIGNFGSAAGAFLEPESLRLSTFARQADNPMNAAISETKDQALALIFEDQNLRKQYKEQLKAIAEAEKAQDEARKAQLTQLLISSAISVAGAGLSYYTGGSGASTLGSTDMTGGNPVSQLPSELAYLRQSPTVYTGSRSVIRSSSSAANVSPWRANTMPLPTVDNAKPLYNTIFPTELLPLNPYHNKIDLNQEFYRNAGGVVPGNGYKDETKILATGGEGVVQRRAMKYLGADNLNKINSGATIGVSEEKSEELNERLVAKLDELSQKMGSQSSVVVNVSMDKQGNTKSSTEGDQSNDSKRLNRMIEEAVVGILKKEQRLGGVLRK